MAVKATNQVDIVDLTDGYSVMMSSESASLVGNTSTANAATVTTTIYAYCGSEQVACSVDVTAVTFSGSHGSGITVSKDNNATQPTLTFTVTAGKVSGNCEATIPVVITDTDITINKKFSFTVSKTGATGKGISSTTVEYQKSTNATTAPTGTWSSSPVATSTGEYLWTKTTITYTSGSPTTVYSVAAHGATGGQGPQGDAGRGISSTTVTYQVGTSATSAPTGTWQSSPQSTTAGQYLWTRTVTTYTSGDPTTSYSVAAHGTTGTAGGRWYSGTAITGTSTTATVFSGSGISSAVVGDMYLNTSTYNTYRCTVAGAASAAKWVYVNNVKGAKGDKGDAGDDAITLVIESSAGFIFKNTQAVTTLTARVFQGGEELNATQIAALGAVKWYKDGGSTAVGTGTTLSITAGTVTNHASYTANLEA